MENLWEASLRGNLTSIRRSINLYGSQKVNEYDQKGITPLFLAASENKLDAVELLVTCGADVNLRSKGGYTPLMIAASEGYAPIVRFLLAHQADANLCNDNGWTALICASSFNHWECVKLLLSHPDVDVDRCSNTGCSALYFAAREGFVFIVKELLTHDANVNITSLSGYTPLHIAAEQGHCDVVDVLLDAHADPTLSDQTGRNAWQIAKNEDIRERLYTKMLKRAIKSQPSFLVDVPPSEAAATAAAVTSAAGGTSDLFLTAQQQLSLAHFAASTSSDVLTYLGHFGSQLHQHRQAMDFILQHPVLTDFYLYFHRSVSTTILGFQTLYSQMVVDNRSSQAEQITGMLDNLAQSSNIAAIPLITGILQEIVKLPQDIHRTQVLNHITKCFPSVDSHRYLESLARELTVEEALIIQRTYRAAVAQQASQRSKILRVLQQAAGWLYETVLLRGEESEMFSMNPVQALAIAYASRLLDGLMLLPAKQGRWWASAVVTSPTAITAGGGGGGPTVNDASLTVHVPVTEIDLPVMKCFALGLESLEAYASHRRAVEDSGESFDLDVALAVDKAQAAAAGLHHNASGRTIRKPLPPLPALQSPSSALDGSGQAAATPTTLPSSWPSSPTTPRTPPPPPKPARRRGSSSPTPANGFSPTGSSVSERPVSSIGGEATSEAAVAAAVGALTSQSAPASLKQTSASTITTAVDNDIDVVVDDATISLLQHRLAILETALRQDQSTQQNQLQTLTQEIQRLRASLPLYTSPKPPSSGASLDVGGGYMQAQRQDTRQDEVGRQSPFGGGETQEHHRHGDDRIAAYEALLQSMIGQLLVLQEDVRELQQLPSPSTPPSTPPPLPTSSPSLYQRRGGPPSSSVSSRHPEGSSFIPGVDPGADDIPSLATTMTVAIAVEPGTGGCTCRIT